MIWYAQIVAKFELLNSKKIIITHVLVQKAGIFMKTNPTLIKDAVIENRWYANKMLEEANFDSKDDYADYVGTVSALAVACYNSITNKTANVGARVKDLFDIFGIDAKANTAYTRRFIIACVQIKRTYSPEYVAARKVKKDAISKYKVLIAALIKAKPEMFEGLDDDAKREKALEFPAIAEIVDEYDLANQNIEYLETQEKSIYMDYKLNARAVGKTGSMKYQATKDCLKKVEDILADIINERSLMTTKELLVEAETLKAERKNRKKVNEMTEEQALKALGISINATAK